MNDNGKAREKGVRTFTVGEQQSTEIGGHVCPHNLAHVY